MHQANDRKKRSKNALYLSIILITISVAILVAFSDNRKEELGYTLLNDGFIYYPTYAPVEEEDIGEQIGAITKIVNSKDDLEDWSTVGTLYLEEGTALYMINNQDQDEYTEYAYKKDGEYFILTPLFTWKDGEHINKTLND